MEAATATATGRIESVQGVVVEASFPDGRLPQLNNAIETTLSEYRPSAHEKRI